MRVAPRVGAWIETIILNKHRKLNTVAPRVGAWIETLIRLIKLYLFCVAPRVGAWIETLDNALKVISVESHPVWVRGLKLLCFALSFRTSLVAPRVGAWIETRAQTATENTLRRSHPVWVRGLKRKYPTLKSLIYKSHPVWVRGLKQQNQWNIEQWQRVAPRVGAWIETPIPRLL